MPMLLWFQFQLNRMQSNVLAAVIFKQKCWILSQRKIINNTKKATQIFFSHRYIWTGREEE